jgi:hypothetical protein
MEELTHREYNVVQLQKYPFHIEAYSLHQKVNVFSNYFIQESSIRKEGFVEHKCNRTRLHYKRLRLIKQSL